MIPQDAPGAAGKEGEPSKPAEAAPADGALPGEKTGSPIFYLRDGSKIAGIPKLEALEVQTHYGTLRIPRDQLVRVRFTRRTSPELRERIQRLIGELGNEDFDRRDSATKALAEIGPDALEFLRKAAKSTNDEVKNRSSILIGQLDAKGESKGAAKEDGIQEVIGTDDEVTTLRMTLRGHVSGDEFVIESRYGELKARLADLSGVVFRPAGATSGKFDVTAQHQPTQNWLDTKYEVERGQKLKVEASGQITVRNYGISSGPEGNRDWGSGQSFGNFPMLALVGKIGKRGQPFLIGPAFNGKAPGSGRLYLGIVSFSPYPGGASGSYQVKVQTTGGD